MVRTLLGISSTTTNIEEFGLVAVPLSEVRSVPTSTLDEHLGSYAGSPLYTLRAGASTDRAWSSVVYDATELPVCAIGVRKGHAYVFPLSNAFVEPDVGDHIVAALRSNNCTVVCKRIPTDAETWRAFCRRWGAFDEARGVALVEDERSRDQSLELTADYFNTTMLRSRALWRRFVVFQSSWAGEMETWFGQEALALARSWLPTLCQENRDKQVAYAPIMEYMIEHFDPERHLAWTFRVDHTRGPLGVYIADKLTSHTAGLYCALSSTRHGGATEWMDVTVFMRLWEEHGVKNLLLGGAETPGVEQYVAKLRPEPAKERTAPIILTAARTGRHFEDHRLRLR